MNCLSFWHICPLLLTVQMLGSWRNLDKHVYNFINKLIWDNFTKNWVHVIGLIVLKLVVNLFLWEHIITDSSRGPKLCKLHHEICGLCKIYLWMSEAHFARSNYLQQNAATKWWSGGITVKIALTWLLLTKSECRDKNVYCTSNKNI